MAHISCSEIPHFTSIPRQFECVPMVIYWHKIPMCASCLGQTHDISDSFCSHSRAVTGTMTEEHVDWRRHSCQSTPPAWYGLAAIYSRTRIYRVWTGSQKSLIYRQFNISNKNFMQDISRGLNCCLLYTMIRYIGARYIRVQLYMLLFLAILRPKSAPLEF